jgi:ABC-type phosphate transport system auxiliary subunit
MSAPTDDERVIREREEERARWNEAYGKVLSGTASVEEIQAYYAHRQRLSADYVEFASYLLDHHADDLSDQDIGLLELARRLHLARLAEYPKQTQEAFDRKAKQDEARAAWLKDEEEFGRMAPPE